jgi:hypothetical protein
MTATFFQSLDGDEFCVLPVNDTILCSELPDKLREAAIDADVDDNLPLMIAGDL